MVEGCAGDPVCVRHAAAAAVQHHRPVPAARGLQPAGADPLHNRYQAGRTTGSAGQCCCRLVKEVSWRRECSNLVQHVCQQFYTVPVPLLTPAPAAASPRSRRQARHPHLVAVLARMLCRPVCWSRTTTPSWPPPPAAAPSSPAPAPGNPSPSTGNCPRNVSYLF